MQSDDPTEGTLFGMARSSADAQARARLPLEQLATEFMERIRAGSRPSIEEYVRRAPELADEIRRLFPMIAAMEGWKEDKEVALTRTPLPERLDIERLGRYRLLREIGRGGMGVVFEAEEESLKRRVAVKVLPRRSTQNTQARERFEREAQTAANLKHPHIVPVFAFGEEGNLSYYVMPLINGVGLDWLIERLRSEEGLVYANEIRRFRKLSGVSTGDSAMTSDAATSSSDDPHRRGRSSDRRLTRRSWSKIAKIGAQAADALNHAHQHGQLHRDIKPANILLDANGVVWVTDFGLAIAIEDAEATGHVAGTLQYMPAEQIEGTADERSDVYSLGVTLFELVTLRPAYSAATRADLMELICAGPPPRALEINARVPPALSDIVSKATALHPADRYQSASEMGRDLKTLIRRRRKGRGNGLSRWLGSWRGRKTSS